MPKRKDPALPSNKPAGRRSRTLAGSVVVATARVLVRSGYEAATTNRIAQIAGVSVTSLSQYFPDREALIGAVIDRTVERTSRAFQRKLEKLKGKGFDEAVSLLIGFICDTCFNHRTLFRVLSEQTPQLERTEFVLRLRKEVGEAILGLMEMHGRRPANRELALFVLMNSVLGVVQTAILDMPDGIREEDLRRELTRLAKGYLVSDAFRSSPLKA